MKTILPDVRTSGQIDPTAELIRRRRAERKPTPVHSGRLPRWLSRAIAANADCKGYGDRFVKIWRAGRVADAEMILDHWGTSIIGGETCFVCEPYPQSRAANPFDALREPAERFASVFGLRLEYSLNAWHFPGETVRLIFREVQS